MPVDLRHKSYGESVPRWQRCRDCYDGSDAVKKRADQHLPKLDGHKTKHPEKYKDYQLRALFYNALSRTVDGLAGAIMQRAPAVDLPAGIDVNLLRDVTRGGKSLEMFALDVAKEVLTVGRYGILVDMPREEDVPDGQEALPFLVGYCAESIINWRTEKRGGTEVLTRLVLAEQYEVEDEGDEFAITEETQFRVLRLDGEGEAAEYRQQVWRKEGKEFAVVEEVTPTRRGDKLDFIPFIFLGPTSTEPAIEKPPLDDLAHVNLAHYRNSADYEHGLHWTALPTPWVAGKADDGTGVLSIGSTEAWVLSENGKAGMLEFSGSGLSAIQTAMETKQKQMATLGARLLEDGSGAAETATAVGMRHSGEHATLRTVAQSIESGLTSALRIFCWFISVVPTINEVEASFELNKDFFATRMTTADLQALVQAFQADAISFETFYHNLTKGEVARPNVTAEEERRAIEDQVKVRQERAPALMPPTEGEEDEEELDDEEDVEDVEEKPKPPVPPKPGEEKEA